MLDIFLGGMRFSKMCFPSKSVDFRNVDRIQGANQGFVRNRDGKGPCFANNCCFRPDFGRLSRSRPIRSPNKGFFEGLYFQVVGSTSGWLHKWLAPQWLTPRPNRSLVNPAEPTTRGANHSEDIVYRMYRRLGGVRPTGKSFRFVSCVRARGLVVRWKWS